MSVPRGRDRPGKLGADATKVGIGPGKVCITRLKTGFGTGGWQLSALKWVCPRGDQAHHCRRRHPPPWRHRQSVRFGATMIMIGSLFAGHEESRATRSRSTASSTKELIRLGSPTSTRASTSHVEGKRILEPVKGKVFRRHAARDRQEDVQSSVSLRRRKQLADLRKVNYVILGGENAGLEHLFM